MKLSIEQFLQLQSYGYSLDEIRAYEGTGNQQPAVTDQANRAGGESPQPDTTQPEQQPEPQPEQQPEPQPEQQPEPQPTQDNETQQMLKEMLGIMRAQNINNMGSTGPANVDTAAIMATILTPQGEPIK